MIILSPKYTYRCKHTSQIKASQESKKSMQSIYRGDDVVADALNRLKDQLSESNNVNIGNLTALNTNIELLFNYFRDAFLALAQEKEALQCKLSSIVAKLKKNNLSHLLEEQSAQIYNNNQYWSNLQYLNQQMQAKIMRKNDFQAINCDARSQRSTHNSKRAPLDKQTTKEQYRRASNFVRQYLVNKLQVDKSRSIQLPKNSILNLYLRWRQKNNDPVDFQFQSSIQMALTSQIKRQFPQCTHNARSFRGIQFLPKYQHILRDQLKTDVKASRAQSQESEDISPQLPKFADDDLADE